MAPSLAALPVFAAVNPENLSLLDQKTTTRRVRRGTVLVHQHDPPDRLYLVLAGRFFVIPPGRQEAIAEIGPGEPIGELAFLTGVGRTAKVIAARDSEVLVLPRDAYAEVTRKFPDILVTILAAVAKRLARVTGASPSLRRRPPQTIALLPIGEDTRLPDGFASALADAMAPTVAVAVSSTTFGETEADGNADQLHDRLATLENSVDLVLFALDRIDSPFTRVCLGLADHLALVAPMAGPGSSATEVSAFESRTSDLFLPSRRTLIFTREHATQPTTGTARWFEGRDVNIHHHVALSDRRDIEKLGRCLTGRARGLVMGGGAALGCAHLGVAKALRESGTPIDFFGGTSVGSAMGAAMAMGLSPDTVMDLTEEMFVADRAMHRVTLPLFSLLDHRVMDLHLSRNLHGLHIEDLPFNYFAVSANLTTNSLYVHRRGVAWQAVRASSAIPGVLPPFITETGDVLVDGGIVDNLPVAVMHDLKSGPNVVVSLRRRTPWRVDARYDETPTRRTIVRDLLFRRSRQYPSMATVLIHGLTMASEQRRGLPHDAQDLFVTPPGTEQVGLLDWHRGRELLEGAYRDMADRIEKAGGFDALVRTGA